MKKGLVILMSILAISVVGCTNKAAEKADEKAKFKIIDNSKDSSKSEIESEDFDIDDFMDKAMYIEIRSAEDDSVLKEIKDKEGLKKIESVLSEGELTGDWDSIDNKKVDSKEKYIYVVYQEKTSKALKDKENEGYNGNYEEIIRYTTYEDPEYLSLKISDNVIKNFKVSDFLDDITFKIDKKSSDLLNNINQL